jgi:pimeloyl-ACP methyl ester carboxylesterase
MKKLLLIHLLVISLITIGYGQTEKTVRLKTSTGDLEGTLMVAAPNVKNCVALLIAGSGPTDRDGNNTQMKNNSLKMIALALNKAGIASLRYDKRGIAKSQSAGLKEEVLRFDHYVNDAKEWVAFLKKEYKFTNVVIIGHSEGSLIGMIAAQEKNVNKYVSIAGAGQPADRIMREQMKSQPPALSIATNTILDELAAGRTVDNTPVSLNALFRKSVQPYIISWIKYDPQKEIAKLKIPVLILQGTTDIQVSVDDANRLAKALPAAKLVIINGMNHILKEAPLDRQQNILTYSQPDLPLKKELMENIVAFINK